MEAKTPSVSVKVVKGHAKKGRAKEESSGDESSSESESESEESSARRTRAVHLGLLLALLRGAGC